MEFVTGLMDMLIDSRSLIFPEKRQQGRSRSPPPLMATMERCKVRFRDVKFFSPLAEYEYEQMVREMKDLTADVRHVHWLDAYIPECINGTTQLSVWRLDRELLLLLGYEELPGMHMLVNRYVKDTVIPIGSSSRQSSTSLVPRVTTLEASPNTGTSTSCVGHHDT
ncbi:hypothetical protein SELMODRAFT_422519 [Selaginella moellendorffii]|uniref:Uncharacterized protein n=1 Tax=Selaginella moellendorffii TaxID=88036 RepID=D8SIP8_SELML|nr:hypothetical protein SELMODRAFT_422519 [Selaginella moellendorffii]